MEGRVRGHGIPWFPQLVEIAILTLDAFCFPIKSIKVHL